MSSNSRQNELMQELVDELAASGGIFVRRVDHAADPFHQDDSDFSGTYETYAYESSSHDSSETDDDDEDKSNAPDAGYESAHDDDGDDNGAPLPQRSVGESRPFTLTDNPLAALEANDAHRRPDVGDGDGSDLWSLEQVRKVMPQQYSFPVPTFVPQRWPVARPRTQPEYTERFRKEFPIVGAMFNPETAPRIPNVVVAGGAAAWPLGEGNVPAGDVDLFIYGLSPGDEGALWRKVGEVSRALITAINAHPSARSYTQILSPGLLTFLILSAKNPQDRTPMWRAQLQATKVQVILRAYPSISAILHAFDVPSACVAFDGTRTYTTTLGAYAHVYRVNVVAPAYRSLTYESRLRKYFERGFGLALPHLDPAAFRRGQPLALPHLTLNVATARHMFASGTVEVPGASADSDYDAETMKNMPRRYSSLAGYAEFGVIRTNIRQIANGENRWRITRTMPTRPYMFATGRRRLTAAYAKPIQFESFAIKGPPGFHTTVLPRLVYASALDRLIKATVSNTGAVNSRTLTQVLGLTSAEVVTFARAVAATIAAQPVAKRVDPTEALTHFRDRLHEKYHALPDRIEWWIKDDPGRQYTAARNPRMEDPATWYGAAYRAPTEVNDSAGISARMEVLLGLLESSAINASNASGSVAGSTFADGACPLCHEALVPGARNSTVLPCGHTFHSAQDDDGCLGIIEWLRRGNTDCPCCRHSLAHGDSDNGSESDPRLLRRRGAEPLVVQW